MRRIDPIWFLAPIILATCGFIYSSPTLIPPKGQPALSRWDTPQQGFQSMPSPERAAHRVNIDLWDSFKTLATSA